MALVVKRKGHKEDFDERKVYASVYAACINTHIEKEDAEEIAEAVVKKVKEFTKGKEWVTSNQIFVEVTNYLEDINKNISFMYSTHRDVS